MSKKRVFIKLDSAGLDTGSFNIIQDVLHTIPTIIASGITRSQLLAGMTFSLNNAAYNFELESTGMCNNTSIEPIPVIVNISAGAYLYDAGADEYQASVDAFVYNEISDYPQNVATDIVVTLYVEYSIGSFDTHYITILTGTSTTTSSWITGGYQGDVTSVRITNISPSSYGSYIYQKT